MDFHINAISYNKLKRKTKFEGFRPFPLLQWNNFDWLTCVLKYLANNLSKSFNYLFTFSIDCTWYIIKIDVIIQFFLRCLRLAHSKWIVQIFIMIDIYCRKQVVFGVWWTVFTKHLVQNDFILNIFAAMRRKSGHYTSFDFFAQQTEKQKITEKMDCYLLFPIHLF